MCKKLWEINSVSFGQQELKFEKLFYYSLHTCRLGSQSSQSWAAHKYSFILESAHKYFVFSPCLQASLKRWQVTYVASRAAAHKYIPSYTWKRSQISLAGLAQAVVGHGVPPVDQWGGGRGNGFGRVEKCAGAGLQLPHSREQGGRKILCFKTANNLVIKTWIDLSV